MLFRCKSRGEKTTLRPKCIFQQQQKSFSRSEHRTPGDHRDLHLARAARRFPQGAGIDLQRSGYGLLRLVLDH